MGTVSNWSRYSSRRAWITHQAGLASGAGELLQRLSPDVIAPDPWQPRAELSNTVATLRKWWSDTGKLPPPNTTRAVDATVQGSIKAALGPNRQRRAGNVGLRPEVTADPSPPRPIALESLLRHSLLQHLSQRMGRMNVIRLQLPPAGTRDRLGRANTGQLLSPQVALLVECVRAEPKIADLIMQNPVGREQDCVGTEQPPQQFDVGNAAMGFRASRTSSTCCAGASICRNRCISADSGPTHSSTITRAMFVIVLSEAD